MIYYFYSRTGPDWLLSLSFIHFTYYRTLSHNVGLSQLP